MAFVVEDGTGKTNSTSYATVAEFRAYWQDRGVNYLDYDSTVIEQWLVIATEFIDTHFRFWGYATNYDTQALQWPRTGLRDSKGNLITSTTIPNELKNAVYRLAREATASPDLDSKIETGEKSKRMGPVSITYKDAYKKEFKIVNNLLRGMIKNNCALGVVS